MRFLKINDQTAINMATIDVVKVTGTELSPGSSRVTLEVVTRDGSTYIVRRFSTFAAAETALDDLVREIEAVT